MKTDIDSQAAEIIMNSIDAWETVIDRCTKLEEENRKLRKLLDDHVGVPWRMLLEERS